ncbi:type II toxin-antitoxin system RelE/ParE family toxin [Endozoicomonas sp.]|uniref:type II toxin-antitoxin system RelE/ParE family toxin n=1 Tax=Endozoicomonas sp. TaxID=1892382 RepID=UPI0028855685|nr:type II toxin-antitoxin system RelE/ParE family toxin [Endozoicomonas sp.]
MTTITEILQTSSFKKTVRKLHSNQKKDLYQAITDVVDNPLIGEQKKGDLSNLRVYKFKMEKQLALLGYQYVAGTITLTLISVGSHENFYRDIKRSF